MAAYYAVKLCRDMGVTNLLLEGDAQNVVNAVKAREIPNCRYGHLIGDIKCALMDFFFFLSGNVVMSAVTSIRLHMA